MKSRLLAILATSLALAPARHALADTPRDSMNAGIREYEADQFEAAAKSFGAAAQNASGTKLDPARAHYNEGNALMQLKRAQDASQKYTDALRSTDLNLQRKAYFNRGNALYDIGEAARATGEFDAALKALEEALAMYENAIALDPRDRDSKINYELTLKKQEEVRQEQEQQQQQQQDQNQDQKQDEKKDEPEQSEDENKQDEQEEQQQQEQQDQGEQQQQQQQQAQPERAEEMTPEEAQVLLDAMRQEEQAARERYRVMRGQPVPVEKDW